MTSLQNRRTITESLRRRAVRDSPPESTRRQQLDTTEATPTDAHSLRFWVVLVTALLFAATLVSAGGTAYERRRLGEARHEIRVNLRPAQGEVAGLLRAYVDQETGQRGFMLTGAEDFLDPYKSGTAAAAKSIANLTRYSTHIDGAPALLSAVVSAADDWRRLAAEPQIALRRSDTSPSAGEDLSDAVRGRTLFDALRTRVGALSDRVNAEYAIQLQHYDGSLHESDLISLIAVIFALLVAILSIVLLSRKLTRPVERLVRDVKTVADGSYEHRIVADGPREVATVARSVQSMRDNIVIGARDLADSQQREAILDERNRLASDLQHLTVQGLFAIGLTLTSLASQSQELAEKLGPVIDETDRVIRELRSVIFSTGQTE